MIFTQTKLKGCVIIEPKVHKDDRGYFLEAYHHQKFEKGIGQKINFVQDNQSFSTKAVLRGIHYQIGDYAQAKLTRVLSGKVLDIAVDLRKDSSTYGEHIALELSNENKKQLFIPRGFGHGFVVLSDTAEFFYKCDNYYNKEAERGIIYNDSSLKIDWQVPFNQIIVAKKDLILPSFKQA